MRRGFAIAALLLFACDAKALLCIVTDTGVAFGIYSPLTSPPLTSTGTVTVTCTALVPVSETYTVKLSTGASSSFSRYMSSGSNTLNYNIYVDSGRTSIWGDGTSGTSYQTFSGTLPLGVTITNFTAYGNIPSQQNAQLGIYGDLIVITVAY